MHELMCELRQNTAFMGGVPCIFAGDQRQCLPITRDNSIAAAVANDVKSNPLFKQFRVFRLTQPMRNAADPGFCRDVDDIGNGVAAGPLPPAERLDEHFVYVPEGVELLPGTDDAARARLLQFVHPNLDPCCFSVRCSRSL
jgi:hypothetical protein